MEIYYEVSGSGAVCHTINPRLAPEQIVYLVTHAEDKCLFMDLTFVPLIEKLADQLPKVKGFVIMTDEVHMPKTALPNVICYETLVASADDDYQKIINCRRLRNKKRESRSDHTANSPFEYSLLQPLEEHAEAFKGTTFRN